MRGAPSQRALSFLAIPLPPVRPTPSLFLSSTHFVDVRSATSWGLSTLTEPQVPRPASAILHSTLALGDLSLFFFHEFRCLVRRHFLGTRLSASVPLVSPARSAQLRGFGAPGGDVLSLAGTVFTARESRGCEAAADGQTTRLREHSHSHAVRQARVPGAPVGPFPTVTAGCAYV